MANGKRRLYWESSVWLSLVIGEAGRMETCQHLLEDARQGKIEIATSAFTLAEVIRDKG